MNRPGGLHLTRLAAKLSGLQPGDRVLDVASGSGSTVQFLSSEMGMKAAGIDLSLQTLKMGLDHQPGLSQVQALESDLPVAANSQDAVMIECALSLTGHGMRELSRVLRTSGKLIVTDIFLRELSDPQIRGCLSASPCLSGALTRSEIEFLVRESGLNLVLWQDHTPVFKSWLAGMVFKLGSLQAVYRQLVSCDADATSLLSGLGNGIKLGYYLMIAQKAV